jgi:hypothetical protein
MDSATDNISDLAPEAPDPDRVLKDVGGISPTIYEALEGAAISARGFFEARGESVEPYHFASHVRYDARQYLVRRGHKVDFELGDLPNNGLMLTYGRYSIRIRKSDEGDVPIPGASTVLQRFYHQLSLRFNNQQLSKPINLLILWDVLKPSYVLAGDLLLVYPTGGAITRDSVTYSWMVSLPHPALAPPVAPPKSPEEEMAQTDEEIDLDIRLSTENTNLDRDSRR